VIALALALALGGTPTPFFWPKPLVVEEIDIPSVMKADGVPVRLHLIRSKLSVQELLDTFATAFAQAGFYVAKVQKRRVAEPHVTGLDWVGLISYSAILSPNSDGTTTCMLGEASLGAKKTAEGAPPFAPVFPGAQQVVRVDQEGARVMTYVAQTGLDEVRRFYREALPKTGYRPLPDRADAWERDGAELSVLLSGPPKRAGDGAVSVVVVQSQR
jgi:hypothetical protein